MGQVDVNMWTFFASFSMKEMQVCESSGKLCFCCLFSYFSLFVFFYWNQQFLQLCSCNRKDYYCNRKENTRVWKHYWTNVRLLLWLLIMDTDTNIKAVASTVCVFFLGHTCKKVQPPLNNKPQTFPHKHALHPIFTLLETGLPGTAACYYMVTKCPLTDSLVWMPGRGTSSLNWPKNACSRMWADMALSIIKYEFYMFYNT